MKLGIPDLALPVPVLNPRYRILLLPFGILLVSCLINVNVDGIMRVGELILLSGENAEPIP